MTQVDQFESVFRSAIRSRFLYKKLSLHRFLCVCDLSDENEIKQFQESLKAFVKHCVSTEESEWTLLSGSDFQSTSDLLEKVQSQDYDLIFTYRNLHSNAWKFPHSLGEHLDVLLQKVQAPVMVMPHPNAPYAREDALTRLDTVLAMTDHLNTDSDLVNYALAFTPDKGTLFLSHLEDEAVFEKYIEAISCISTIDTEEARQKISHQLLKGPEGYVDDCKRKIGEVAPDLKVESRIQFGHHLKEYQNMVEDLSVDLLVVHTRDEDQLALHGLVYPLSVELREIPILMI